MHFALLFMNSIRFSVFLELLIVIQTYPTLQLNHHKALLFSVLTSDIRWKVESLIFCRGRNFFVPLITSALSISSSEKFGANTSF